MKNYRQDDCQRFIDTALLLEKTEKRMQDIYETMLSLHTKETAAVFFNNQGKAFHYNYVEYRDRAEDFALRLAVLLKDIPAESVIGLKLRNCPEWPLLFWAILMNGFTPLLIDARLAKENTINLVEQSAAKAVFADEKEDYDVPCFTLASVYESDSNPDFVPHWGNKVIFCSSGTTGAIKLMVFDGKALCAQIMSATSIPSHSQTLMHPGKINILGMIPFHHVFGFVAVFLWFTFFGKAIVYPYSINSRDLLYAIKKGQVTHVFSVPLFWDSIAQNIERSADDPDNKKDQGLLPRLIDYKTGKISKKEAGFAASGAFEKLVQKRVFGTQVEYCISGGGYLSPKTLNIINGVGYPLYNGYGMTEFGVSSVEQSPVLEDRLRASIGIPFAGVSYKLKNEKDGQGELLVKTGSLHIEEIVGGVHKEPEYDEEGYMATGDIAAIDADGRCYIRGRIKDVIINANGENVYPDELEFYFKGLPFLKQNVVLGVKGKKKGDEDVTLVLELDHVLNEMELKELNREFERLNNNLPNEKKVVRLLIYKNQLPLANGMKVKRYVIKELLESKKYDDFLNAEGGELSGKEAAKPKIDLSRFDAKEAREVLDKIKEVWGKVLVVPVEKIEDNAHFEHDLGGDSMSYVAMVQDLNVACEVTIPIEKYGVLLTVDSFAEEILTIRHEG